MHEYMCVLCVRKPGHARTFNFTKFIVPANLKHKKLVILTFCEFRQDILFMHNPMPELPRFYLHIIIIVGSHNLDNWLRLENTGMTVITADAFYVFIIEREV